MRKCRICESTLAPFLPFGKMPLANAFLFEKDLSQEPFFDLTAAFCERCAMVQLVDQPEREQMFHSAYPFRTGSSQKMTAHFRKLAAMIAKNHLNSEDPLVVEIGSNDGTFLANFSARKVRHIGFDPAANVSAEAIQKGVRTHPVFFDRNTALQVKEDLGQADVIAAANVMCHIPDIHSVLEGVKLLLKPDGVFIFEDPTLSEVLAKVSYDQIYDEHVFLFSALSADHAMRRHGLEVIDLEPIPTHGGSMRFTVSLQGAFPVSPRVRQQLQWEQSQNMDRLETYLSFRKRCEESRDSLRELLTRLHQQSKRVMGYAATSKSTTVTNYCGITTQLVESICDTTPEKQGRLSPGAHLPIVPYEAFQKNYPDYALLFGWNHREEIFAKEQGFLEAGGKWIIYVPEVREMEMVLC